MSRIKRLERLIDHAEQRLQRATAEVDKVRAELNELRGKLELAREEEKQLELPLDIRTRGVSEKWAAILNFMVLRSPNPVALDEIVLFAAQNNLDISRSSARAQLHNYVKRGLIERLADGLFLPTDEARIFCNY